MSEAPSFPLQSSRRARAWLLVASACVAAGPGVARGATPCRDIPGFESLGCRVAALREDAQAQPLLARRLARAAERIDQGAASCLAGHTALAKRRLDGVRFRLFGAERALARLVRRGLLHPLDARGLEGQLRFAQTLRRAARARLSRTACPDLVEILRPGRGEVVRDDEIFLLFEFASAADPGSVEVARESPAPGPVFATLGSSPQFFVRTECEGTGRHTFRIRVRNRADTLTDERTVSVECGASGFALGAEVETLVEPDHAPNALRLTPVRPLRSGASYAVVATTNLRTRSGQRIQASEAFKLAAGLGVGAAAAAPQAYYSSDPTDPRNPFPSERLVRPDGTIRIPNGFTARAVPEVPRLEGVRDFLRGLDLGSEEHRGFSSSASVVLHFSEPINLRRAGPERLFLVEIANPGPSGTNLPALLDALEAQRGIAPADVAVASVFPVEDLRGTMAGIRAQIEDRAASAPPQADFADPDPNDARAIGIFHPGDAEFAEVFDGVPPASVGTVARGRFPSPDYRENGRFPDRFLDGSEIAPHVALEFVLALPAGPPPEGGFPTVVLQHGFTGSDDFVTDNAADFSDAGLAVIGISAPEHGRRGSFLNFFAFDDFNAFGNNFRQATVDLLQLVRLIEAGIDLDGDAGSELRASELGYLGVSLGGVIGGVFAAVEPKIGAALLNVPGGRLAQFAGSSSSLALPFLESFAAAAGIPSRTCDGDPLGSACMPTSGCTAGASCRLNADFELLLESALMNFQTQLDPGDGIGYARGFRIEPASGSPKPVLIQEGIGDIIVANPLTEALARGIGLPANRADASAAGVAGLWRYPPPTGHGIFGLPEVRAQAVSFLASGGTLLAEP